MDDKDTSQEWEEANATWWAAVSALTPGLTQEEQDRFAAMSHDVRESLATNPTISRETFLKLEADDELHEALMHNPSLPDEILERWAFEREFNVLAHPNATDIVRAFAQTEDDWEASDAHLTYDIVADWVNGDLRFVERGLWRKHEDHAKNYFDYEAEAKRVEDEFLLEIWAATLPFTPAHVLERITAKFLPRLAKRRSPVTNLSTVPQVAIAIQESSDTRLLVQLFALVATHSNATSKLLTELADSGYALLASRVARNPNAPLPTLKRLLHVRDSGMSIAIANHPATKVQKLVTDLAMRGPDVQAALARSRHLAAWQLDDLANTDSLLVLGALAGNASYKPSDPDKLSGHPTPYVRSRAAANPNFDLATLQRLADDPEEEVRHGVAANPGAPESLLVKLYATDTTTYHQLAANASTPLPILVNLHHDERHHAALARNPNLPAEVQQTLAASGSARVARSLARNADTSPDTLHVLALSEDPQTQFLVSTHNSSNPETLHLLLSEDRYWRARFAARRRLEDATGDMDIYAPIFRPKGPQRLSDISFEREPDS